MSTPFFVVPSGGLPVINTPNGTPMDLVTNGNGIAVTIVASGGFGIAANLNGYSTYVPIYYFLGF